MVKRDFQRLPVFLMSFILAFTFCSPISYARSAKEKAKKIEKEKPDGWIDFITPTNTATTRKPILVKPAPRTSQIQPREINVPLRPVSSALEPIQITKLAKVPEPENTGENKRHKKR